jgi:hypothetical protein
MSVQTSLESNVPNLTSADAPRGRYKASAFAKKQSGPSQIAGRAATLLKDSDIEAAPSTDILKKKGEPSAALTSSPLPSQKIELIKSTVPVKELIRSIKFGRRLKQDLRRQELEDKLRKELNKKPEETAVGSKLIKPQISDPKRPQEMAILTNKTHDRRCGFDAVVNSLILILIITLVASPIITFAMSPRAP